MDLSTLLTLVTGLLLGLALGALIGWLWAGTRHPGEEAVAALESRAADQAVVREGLDRLADQLRDLHHDRATWQGEFNAQVRGMQMTTESLRRETSSLATALRKPQVRGRWGEMHLRRAVELAGMVDRCDFTEQHRLDDGALRPDLVVHLAGGRHVVVDAKVPLDAFLDATAADDDQEREAHLARHARQLRTHVAGLSDKAYWKSLPGTPEFVVLFVPAEAFLSAALEAEPRLLEHAAERRVVLATPTTLIALLRTVAQGWSHETLAGQVAEVQRLGRELYDRLGTMGDHVAQVGRSLGSAVKAYNQAVGSLEGRVLVTARRFEALGVVDPGLDEVRQVDLAPREPSAPELALLDEREPFPDLAGLSAPPQEGTDASDDPARRSRGA
ncbi:DNA recombination protein RmuC [Nocardioides solisilvae]|uniref:DNA recombination protein RmuC n=1 Tax=Nocardioides solisilvae TaxID=1542435 RepID=UPI000D744228|nr:DNA recombination protein RmuC [Nocardioides solisilvae]